MGIVSWLLGMLFGIGLLFELIPDWFIAGLVLIVIVASAVGILVLTFGKVWDGTDWIQVKEVGRFNEEGK